MLDTFIFNGKRQSHCCHYFFIISFLFLFSPKIFSQSIELKTDTAIFDLQNIARIYIDKKGDLRINNIVDSIQDEEFKISTEKSLNYGFSSSSIWCKIKITNRTDNEDWYLHVPQATLDYLELFVFGSDGRILSERTGEFFPFNSRKLKVPDYLFDVKIKKNSEVTILLNVKSPDGLRIPIKISSAGPLFHFYSEQNFWSGCYFGFLFLIIIYNLCIYFNVKERIYLLYVAYITCMAIISGLFTGQGFSFLWTRFPVINEYVYVFPFLGFILGILFIQSLLESKKHVPNIHKGFNVFIGISIISIFLSLSENLTLSLYLMNFVGVTLPLYIIITGIVIYKQKQRFIKFFILGWVSFFAFLLLECCYNFNWLPINDFSNYVIPIGSSMEAFFLSFALSSKIGIYKREAHTAKREAEGYHNELKEAKKEAENFSFKISEYIKQIDSLRAMIELRAQEKFDLKDINKILTEPLTEREIETLELIIQGKTNKQVAEEIHISFDAVRARLKRIYEKLEVKNRTEATKKVYEIKF